jgi:hypothetical protein
MVLALGWAGSPVLLRTLVLVLVQLSGWVCGVVVVHRPVLQMSTIEWSSNNLPLLGFVVGTDSIIRDHDIAHKLWKYPSSVERHVLL